MYVLDHDVLFIENAITTPSYLINPQNYLPKIYYNLDANNRTQLLLIYRELIRILTAIKKYIRDADNSINTDLENQLQILRSDYPIIYEKYANYCSTIANLIYKDTINFNDINIQKIYNDLQNKIMFTVNAQNIIKQVSNFINSRRNRYNNLVDTINNSTNNNYEYLIPTDNYINDNYMVFVDNNLLIYKNANSII